LPGVEELQPKDIAGYSGKGKEHEFDALQVGAVECISFVLELHTVPVRRQVEVTIGAKKNEIVN
jgi:hypothetical protein